MPDNDIDTTRSTEVLVVGAGPTGLMTALLLHRSGIQIRILDKNDQQAHESRAFALQARSLELLLNLGIVDAFIEQATITPGMQIYVNGHKAAEANLTDIGANDSPYAFLLMLPQSKIEKLLAAELEKEGITVEHNMEVTTFAQDDSGVAVTAINKQGEEIHIHADYVVGADGGHSVIRHGLGLTFDGHAYTQSFMLADCSIHWPLDYAFGKIFLRGTSLAIYLPMDGQKMGRIIAVTPDKNLTDSIASKDATTAEPLELAEVQKALRDASGLEITLSDPAWVTRYRIHHRGTNQYGVGRIYIAGDAAHIHSPMGGQGMLYALKITATKIFWILTMPNAGLSGKNY
jgi:2-polyprenyl-6-methoxyphenol hydroxylase-like FAD-dependent oxidoreductase